MLPKAPHSWPGDLEDVRKSTPSPFRDLLAVDTFSRPSWPKAFQNPDAGAKCLLHQGKDSCLPSGQDTNPCFSAAQLEHVSRGVWVQNSSGRARGTASSIPEGLSGITALGRARCLGPALQPRAELTWLQKYVPHWPHKQTCASWTTWFICDLRFRGRDFCIFLILSGTFEGTVQEHETFM